MHRHHDNDVAAFVIAVNIRDERNLFKVAKKTCFFPFCIYIGFNAGNQLSQVFQAGLALFALCLQHRAVSSTVNHKGNQLVQRLLRSSAQQFFVHCVKLLQRCRSAGKGRIVCCRGGNLQHTARKSICDLRHVIDGSRTNFAGRLVDNAPQTQIILRVCQNRKIRQNVLDFFSVKEALAADDFIRNTGTREIGLDRAGLGVHAVQNGMVAKLCALFDVFTNYLGNMGRFVMLIICLIVVYFVAIAVFSPQCFTFSALIVFDDLVGCVQNIRGGTVVLLEPNHLGPREMLFKTEDVLDGCAAETIDALIIVANDADVAAACRQLPHKLKLRHAGILIFVYQNVTIFRLVFFQHVRVLFKQSYRLENQIVKIKCTCRAQTFGVCFVNIANQFRAHIASLLCCLLIIEHLIFVVPDCR